MSALSPCISFVLILLISRASGFSWRESTLAAAVVWGLLLTIITEALSAFEALSYMTILASWLLSDAALAVLYLWFFMDRTILSVSVRPVASASLLFVLPIGFIVSLTGLIAFVAPPNNWDSMTYHLGRVVHWIQNHNVQHYPTSIDRQLFMPPWAEFAITHFYVLSGGDRLSNGVQWFSMLGSLTGVSLIAKQLGGSKESQLLAALIAACLPMGILQASSTQTDYVVTFWLVCFVFYVLLILELIKSQSTFWPHTIFAGISLGLSFLTKPTAYFLAAPFLAWLFLSLARKLGLRSVKILLAISVIAVVINLGHYIRNLEVFGAPLGPPSVTSGVTNVSVITHGEFSQVISRFASSLIRNTAIEMATPSSKGRRIVEVAVEKLEILLRLERDDRGFRLPSGQNHEDTAGNPIHFLLIILCVAALFGAAKRGRTPIVQYYVLSLFTAYLVFCFFLGWNIWITRLHLSLLVLWSAAIAIALSGTVLARVRTYIVVLLVVASQFALLYNDTRPLLGGKNIFVMPRFEQYFRNRPYLYPQYVHAAFLLKDKLCSQVGFLSQGDSWEYPLWVLLEMGPISSLRIEHFRIANQSAKVSVPGAMSDFVPCGLVAVDMTERPDLIVDGVREYSKAWMGEKVAVYEVR